MRHHVIALVVVLAATLTLTAQGPFANAVRMNLPMQAGPPLRHLSPQRVGTFSFSSSNQLGIRAMCVTTGGVKSFTV